MKRAIRIISITAIIAAILCTFVGCKGEIKAPIVLKTTIEIRDDAFDKLCAAGVSPFGDNEAMKMHYSDSTYKTHSVTKECNSLEEAAEALRTFSIDKQNTPVFKEAEFKESGGLFYTSYTIPLLFPTWLTAEPTR